MKLLKRYVKETPRTRYTTMNYKNLGYIDKQMELRNDIRSTRECYSKDTLERTTWEY